MKYKSLIQCIIILSFLSLAYAGLHEVDERITQNSAPSEDDNGYHIIILDEIIHIMSHSNIINPVPHLDTVKWNY